MKKANILNLSYTQNNKIKISAQIEDAIGVVSFVDYEIDKIETEEERNASLKNIFSSDTEIIIEGKSIGNGNL